MLRGSSTIVQKSDFFGFDQVFVSVAAENALDAAIHALAHRFVVANAGGEERHQVGEWRVQRQVAADSDFAVGSKAKKPAVDVTDRFAIHADVEVGSD